MKHKEIYASVRRLIDERELDDENLDVASDDLSELIEEDPECGWAYGLLSEIYYWTGETADPEDKMFYFGEGVKWGEEGVEAEPESLEANFWLSVNWGSFGQEKGIMKSLALISPIREKAELAIGIDESYFYGGPWRVLGRLFHKAPGFPISIGDKYKAEECLEKAIGFGPNFYLNHLFMAELQISRREKERARQELEWILNAPLNRNHEIEDQVYKDQAEALLTREF
ncbi:MAG: hypothetical protein R2684_16950 [Pyrinomonadaceae bacterium]